MRCPQDGATCDMCLDTCVSAHIEAEMAPLLAILDATEDNPTG